MQSGATFPGSGKGSIAIYWSFRDRDCPPPFLSKLLAHKYTVNIVVTAEDGQKIGML